MWLLSLAPKLQAARHAKPEPKPYQWRVTAPDAVCSRLVDILDGCLISDAAARWTVPHVIDALSALRHDVGAGVATAVAMPSGPAAPAPPPVPLAAVDGSAMTYDALELLAGLTSVGVDDAVVAAVADVVGHLAVSSLGVLKPCGVAGMKGVAVRRLLTPRDDYALVRAV